MSNHDPLYDISPGMNPCAPLDSSTASTKHNQSHLALDSTPSTVHHVPSSPPLVPSFKLLFSFLSPRRRLVLLAPAVASSIAAGGIAPFMTYVVGRSFNAFAAFPLSSNSSNSAKDKLLHDVGLAALQLVALGIGALLMSTITSSIWIWTGEYNVVELRKQVYRAIVQKEMEWFDRCMGRDHPSTAQVTGSNDGPIGAGGLMAKFARETDDVRSASSLAAGEFIQYLTTSLSALVLAFVWSPLLTLVILSALPFLIIIQGISQALAGPRLTCERSLTAQAASLVTRVAENISAVKAFNAVSYETTLLARVPTALTSLPAIWGVTAGTSQFVTMAMFVQGFWFGAYLVRQGKNQPGDVMSVFWACLIATSNIQMAVPLMVVLAKGKAAAAELATIISQSNTAHPSGAPLDSVKHRSARDLKRIVPQRFLGDFSLSGVSFAYPTRPDAPVLRDVDMYIPARETTYIVGPSGCGKSTVGSILLGHYVHATGEILLDEQDIRYLDASWIRRHIAGVVQGSAASGAQVFQASVHWNVALGAVGSGRRVEDVTRQEVEEACRIAMLEGWVADLENGYDTILAGSGSAAEEGGITLSGGMRQRLALARARIRDPDVLVLDECTSSLDPPTRLLTTAAIRAWRSGTQKTTIVITHDLGSISADDFVYVMREGRVVEQGFRGDLEKAGGEWERMVHEIGAELQGSDIEREARIEPPIYDDVVDLVPSQEDGGPMQDRHMSVAPSLAGVRPVTMALGGWMFDVVSKLAGTASAVNSDPHDSSGLAPLPSPLKDGCPDDKKRPSSMSILIPSPTLPPRAYDGRRLSLQFTPSSPSFPSPLASAAHPPPAVETDDEFEVETFALQRSAQLAAERRERRHRKLLEQFAPCDTHSLSEKKKGKDTASATSEPARVTLSAPGLFSTLRFIWPSIPSKPLLFAGLVTCLLSGAMTPIFSFLLSRLMFEVSADPSNGNVINSYGGLVLGIAALDGLLLGFKYVLMELSAIQWVTRMRDTAYVRVLCQDKVWFDTAAHAPAALAQVLVKDSDDARALLSVVLGQCVVVVAMMSLGLLWAMVWGWQLTLVGIAIGPVFVAVMGVQAGLVAKCEVRNKRAREEVARVYYESIINVRSIRAMSLEPVLQEQFDNAASTCLSTGIRGALFEGCTYGVASALIYLAEALLFYVGAILIAHGTYTYLQMVQVLNLVVFTVTIGSQLMAFTHKIAKSVQATIDLYALVQLPTDQTNETRGILRPPLTGDLVLKDVAFTYPTQPDQPVLRGFSITVAEGESIALVGASGCGKSTVAALLQRLYEPNSGTISIGLTDIRNTDIHYLRDHIAVVSQQPNLFSASVRENIVYGRSHVMSDEDITRAACAANMHDFVMGLSHGYDTPIGENAALLSGGQAQRLQIARALARPSKILILDECTSALDGKNQAAVLDALQGAKARRTTLMITHQLPVMKMCDRIAILQDGVVCEQGTYEELMQRKGLFAKLTSGGEWLGG